MVFCLVNDLVTVHSELGVNKIIQRPQFRFRGRPGVNPNQITSNRSAVVDNVLQVMTVGMPDSS